MTNKEKEDYFYHRAKIFAKTGNKLIKAFMIQRLRFKEQEYLKFCLIFMGLQETAYFVDGIND